MGVINYTGKINFLNFKNACVISVKGKAGDKKGVFIPIEDNYLFVSSDSSGKSRSIYADFIAFKSNGNSRYGDSHGLKLSVPKNIRDKMTEKELRDIPFFGNMRPFDFNNKDKNNYDGSQFEQQNTWEKPKKDKGIESLPF